MNKDAESKKDEGSATRVHVESNIRMLFIPRVKYTVDLVMFLSTEEILESREMSPAKQAKHWRKKRLMSIFFHTHCLFVVRPIDKKWQKK